MRLCRIQLPDGPTVATVEEGRLLPRAGADLLAALVDTPPRSGDPVELDDAVILAPFRPGTLLGIGHNYREHAAELGAEPPSEPHVFVKLSSSVTAPGGPVIRPGFTDELDYEGELAVVIGREARRVPVEDALGYVGGYAIIDDISARDRQRSEPRWVRAKGGDTFAPLGPWVTTPDEIEDPQSLSIRTWVNGDLRQDGTTADMIFGVAELIAYCSDQFTLSAGDIIATGTPSGVGAARTPPEFLQPGDRVRIEIEALGAIEHAIAAE